jgi:hypothetical protein
MSAADWLVPMDDIVTACLRWCTGGGRRGGTSVVDIATVGPWAVALTLCERCRANAPERTALTALLHKR